MQIMLPQCKQKIIAFSKIADFFKLGLVITHISQNILYRDISVMQLSISHPWKYTFF